MTKFKKEDERRKDKYKYNHSFTQYKRRVGLQNIPQTHIKEANHATFAAIHQSFLNFNFFKKRFIGLGRLDPNLRKTLVSKRRSGQERNGKKQPNLRKSFPPAELQCSPWIRSDCTISNSGQQCWLYGWREREVVLGE